MTRTSCATTVVYALYFLVSCDAAVPEQAPAPLIKAEGGEPHRQERVSADAERANVLPEISVAILGPIGRLKGHEWPRGYDWARKQENQPVSMTAADTPHELVVHLPSGRTLRHYSKATFFNQKRGIVDRASLMPQPGLLRYQEAIALLEGILRQWDAELDDRTKQAIAQWKEEGDLEPYELAKRLGGAVLHGEDKAGIAFEIRPSKNEDGWFLTIDVAAKWNEVARILGLGELPSSQPATKTSENEAERDQGQVQ